MRAWDAADEYVLRHVDAEGIAGDRWLVVNDSFGALACGFHAHGPQWLSDSHLSLLGTQDNLERNNLDPASLGWLSSFEQPQGPLDVVVIKVPKTLALLEDQLHRLRPLLHDKTVVLGAGMAKHIHTSTLDLFTNLVGPTVTSRAEKKARLIFAQMDPELDVGTTPHPVRYSTDDGGQTVNHAGIFSQAKLDIGTRFLLDQMPGLRLHQPKEILDLGCGNGLLGTVAGGLYPDAMVTFVDESTRAVVSATETWRANHGDRPAKFLVVDVLDGIADGSVDVILLNPPFHDQHAISDAVALRMFDQARRALRPGGQLVVVANRNLGYHLTLQRVFDTSTTITGNKKFAILQASV